METIREALDAGTLPPMEAKKQLAREITASLYSEAEAAEAESYFEATIQRRETPDEMPEHAITGATPLRTVLVDAELASSGGEVRRLVGQGAVTVNGERVDDFTIDVAPGDELKVGRHRFLRLVEGGAPR